MKKRQLIPPLPEPFVLTEELEANLKDWIEYFKNMSPRVAIRSSLDKDFLEKLKEYKNAFKLGLEVSDNPEQVRIDGWPPDRQIAFIACFDSSKPGEKEKNYLVKDGIVFCYNDFAFELSDLEQDDYNDGIFIYSMADWPNEEVYTWAWKAHCFLQDLLKQEKSVPKLAIRPN